MNQNIELDAIGPALAKFFKRYHSILFFVVLGGGLAACMFIIVSIIGASSVVDNSLTTPVNTSFDQQTIDRISKLRSGDKSESLVIPNNVRTNPFED